MGWFIAQNLKKGEQMIHFNGTYHSDANNGIIPYLKEYRPKTTVCLIVVIEEESGIMEMLQTAVDSPFALDIIGCTDALQLLQDYFETIPY